MKLVSKGGGVAKASQKGLWGGIKLKETRGTFRCGKCMRPEKHTDFGDVLGEKEEAITQTHTRRYVIATSA